MRHFSTAAVVAALTFGFVHMAAAVDPAQPIPNAPPPAPVYNWTGLYAGLNMGVGWSGADVQTSGRTLYTNPSHTDSLANATASASGSTSTIAMSGANFVGGGQIGYNVQLQSWVVGVEADAIGFSPSNRTSTAQVVTSISGGGTNTSQNTATRTLSYLGTIRARGGFLLTPSLLLYATGGLAYGQTGVATDVVQSRTPRAFQTAVSGNSESLSNRLGWTIGAGAEWMIMPNLSTRLEYIHYDLGSVGNSFVISHYNAKGALTFANETSSRSQFGGNLIRIGLNFHFY